MTERSYTEYVRVAGDQILAVVKSAIHEGNVRRVIIRNEKDQILIELPVTVGVVGVLVAPIAAAIGGIAALVAKCTIEIERVGEPPRRHDGQPEDTDPVDPQVADDTIP